MTRRILLGKSRATLNPAWLMAVGVACHTQHLCQARQSESAVDILWKSPQMSTPEGNAPHD